MTRIGRFVALVGSITVGLGFTAACWMAFRAVLPSLVLVGFLLVPALFGVTTGALFTWTVDGPFVRARTR